MWALTAFQPVATAQPCSLPKPKWRLRFRQRFATAKIETIQIHGLAVMHCLCWSRLLGGCWSDKTQSKHSRPFWKRPRKMPSRSSLHFASGPCPNSAAAGQALRSTKYLQKPRGYVAMHSWRLTLRHPSDKKMEENIGLWRARIPLLFEDSGLPCVEVVQEKR